MIICDAQRGEEEYQRRWLAIFVSTASGPTSGIEATAQLVHLHLASTPLRTYHCFISLLLASNLLSFWCFHLAVFPWKTSERRIHKRDRSRLSPCRRSSLSLVISIIEDKYWSHENFIACCSLSVLCHCWACETPNTQIMTNDGCCSRCCIVRLPVTDP